MPDLPDILRHTRPRRLKTIGVVAACIAVGVVALGVIDRVHADQRLTSWTSAQAIPTVNLVSLNGGVGPQALVLPGDVQAFNTAPIHARVSGYLKAWYVDIGGPVKTGQVLAGGAPSHRRPRSRDPAITAA